MRIFEDTTITVQGDNEAVVYTVNFDLPEEPTGLTAPEDQDWTVLDAGELPGHEDLNLSAGYELEWYMDEACTKQITDLADLTPADFDMNDELTLYAKITGKEITVNFEFFNGEDDTPIVANTKEETFTFDGKDHYVTLDTQADKAYAVKENGKYVFCEDAKLNIGGMTESGTVNVYVFDAEQTVTVTPETVRTVLVIG